MSNIDIAPSILSADFGYLMDEVRAVEPHCRYLHLDVMDGHYVPNMTIGVPVIKTIRKHTDMIFDCHLMITDPGSYIEAFADCGCDYITFQIECSQAPNILCEDIRKLGKKPGIAIHPDTPIETLVPYMEFADLFLVMSVRPGFGGQRYMEGATERIAFVRRELDKIGSSAILSVDGGINKSTIKEAYNAGAKLFVAGSAVFDNSDHGGAVEELIKCALQ